MPATAQTLQYADLVTADVATENQVNLVDYNNYGHRVQISMPVADANAALGWSRAAGTARPIGRFILDNSSAFTDALVTALNAGYTDVDAVTGKLSFDSAVFNTNTDSRIRESGVSANDLVMAYVLCKVYGSSAVTTQEKLFNLEDAHGMLTSEFLAGRINASFTAAEALSSQTTNEKGAIDAMFRDLLASDPTRFFDSDGKQVAGLFESKTDATSSGTWQLVGGDVIETRVEFTFQNMITLRTTRDVSQALNDASGNPLDANKETIIINSGDKFNIRLQLNITDGSGGGGGGGGDQNYELVSVLYGMYIPLSTSYTNGEGEYAGRQTMTGEFQIICSVDFADVDQDGLVTTATCDFGNGVVNIVGNQLRINIESGNRYTSPEETQLVIYVTLSKPNHDSRVLTVVLFIPADT